MMIMLVLDQNDTPSIYQKIMQSTLLKHFAVALRMDLQ